MKWDAYDIAHSIWASQSKVVHDPVKLIATVANKWADEVERHLQIPESIRVIRQRLTDGNVFESAFFAATSPSGELVSSQINFFLDVDLYDKLGQIHVWHEPNKNLGMGGSSRAAIGYSEVAAEFDQQASKRAQAYMKWYLPKISLLKPTSQNAAVAEKLVELTILLHSAQEYLGFPIDELQLVRGTGIHWLHQKKSCQGQSSNSDLPKK